MAGNWKMNLNHLEAIALMQKFAFALPEKYYKKVEVAVLPPFTHIRSIQTMIDGDGLLMVHGAQDLSPHDPNRNESFAALPNVVVIDGGPGQLGAGLKVLQEFRERGVAIISLAKRIEEVFLPEQRKPIVLAHDTPELQLLQRVRDEAHRFAITHHRQKRDKAMTSSIIDGLPGIGPSRKRVLLKHFGSLKKLREADVDQIALVPGIGPRTASAIKDAVAQADATRKTARKEPTINTATGEILED